MLRPLVLLGAALAGGVLLALAPTAHSAEETPGLRVGTFDSRALAMAYYRSDAFSERVRGMTPEEARAAQERAHAQGFGTAPVPELLALVESELPAIADRAGVDVIVSRWDLVYRRPGARLVDVTGELVEPFHPDAETRRVVAEIVELDPVPAEEMHHED